MLRPFMKRLFLTLTAALGLVFVLAPARAAEETVYQNDFEKSAVGAEPDGFLVLNGNFAVREDAGNKFLELPGEPLDTFGALFGPTLKSDGTVSARIFGTSRGRRYPTFGVGLNGQSGYRLQVTPAKKALELYHGETLLASVPYEWKSGQWTRLRLQLATAGAGWKLEGRAWAQGEPEPEKPQVSFDESKEPIPGRAAIWGSPFATTPIWYDDLMVKGAKN